MYITFKELRKSGYLTVDEKLFFYKIYRFFTEKKYAGLVDGDPSMYEYADKIKECGIHYYPGRETEFYLYFYERNWCFVWLHLKVLQNRQIGANFYVDDPELNKNPSVLKEFQIELCKRLGM
jgi:hypothetical protein